ncbi:hypothetical protein T484DRAFT_1855213, partial [Baffinella frigidus]
AKTRDEEADLSEREGKLFRLFSLGDQALFIHVDWAGEAGLPLPEERYRAVRDNPGAVHRVQVVAIDSQEVILAKKRVIREKEEAIAAAEAEVVNAALRVDLKEEAIAAAHAEVVNAANRVDLDIRRHEAAKRIQHWVKHKDAMSRVEREEHEIITLRKQVACAKALRYGARGEADNIVRHIKSSHALLEKASQERRYIEERVRALERGRRAAIARRDHQGD